MSLVVFTPQCVSACVRARARLRSYGFGKKIAVVIRMSVYLRLKNKVNQKLNEIEKVLCEDCCLNRDHSCAVELFHILQHFDRVYSVKLKDQKFRLKLLKDLLRQCVRDSEIIEISINSYKTVRPWLLAEKENLLPHQDGNVIG